MKKIRIVKTVSGEIVQSFEVPLLLVNLSAKFLPKQAIKELEEKGIDINTMKEFSKADENYSSTIEVIERGVKTNIAISLV